MAMKRRESRRTRERFATVASLSGVVGAALAVAEQILGWAALVNVVPFVEAPQVIGLVVLPVVALCIGAVARELVLVLPGVTILLAAYYGLWILGSLLRGGEATFAGFLVVSSGCGAFVIVVVSGYAGFLLLEGVRLLLRRTPPRMPGEAPYCKSCGYSLKGLALDRCPECGMMLVARMSAKTDPNRSD